jgi:peptidoglycan-N-acetylglucosamine deacetylase
MKIFFSIFLLFTFLSTAQEIALSFDDAPRGDGKYFTGEKRTKILVDKLNQLNIKTVFFCNTRGIDIEGKKRLEMYSAAGHLIANHSHSHRNLDTTPADFYLNDIAEADKILSKYDNFVKWFRYPFLREGKTIERRDSVKNGLEEMAYINGFVTIDNYDWYMEYLFQTALKENKKINFEKLKQIYIEVLWDCIKFYDNIAMQSLGRSPKHMLLLHENDLAALFITDLVEHIRKNGGKIISPEEVYEDPIATNVPDVILNNQGRVAAIAKSLGYEGSLSHPTEDEKYLEELFDKKKIFE